MANNESALILVADDEPSTLALVGNHLRARGYRVVEAADGDEAWELCTQELPDLVVLDVMMPGMSGWEVCRRVREAVSLAHTGVIMLTGIGDTLNELTSPLYGADVYMDKPFQFAKLVTAVEETLDKRSKGDLGRPEVTSGPTTPEPGERPAGKAKPRRAKEKDSAAAQGSEMTGQGEMTVAKTKGSGGPAQKAKASGAKAPAPAKAVAAKPKSVKMEAKSAELAAKPMTKKASETKAAPKPVKKVAAKAGPKPAAPAPAKKVAGKPAKKGSTKATALPAKKAPGKPVKAPAKKAPGKPVKAPAKKAPGKPVKAPAKKAARRR